MTYQYYILEVHLGKINPDKPFPLAKSVHICALKAAFKDMSDFLANVLKDENFKQVLCKFFLEGIILGPLNPK
jgi:hypothetical protein